MDDTESKAIILVKDDTDNVAHPIFFGTIVQCKCVAFNSLVPSENRRNLVWHDSDWGYWFSYERLKAGEWKKIEVFIQTLPEEEKKEINLDFWCTL